MLLSAQTVAAFMLVKLNTYGTESQCTKNKLIKHEKYRQINVSEHLARCSNGSFNIMPIYKCENTTRIFRENKEQEIIKLLKPELNSSHHEQQASKRWSHAQ